MSSVSEEYYQNPYKDTGLSPLLRSMMKQPRDENEFNEIKKLLTETLNLTRAAISRGLMVELETLPDFDIRDNSMFKPYLMARDILIDERT